MVLVSMGMTQGTLMPKIIFCDRGIMQHVQAEACSVNNLAVPLPSALLLQYSQDER